METPDRRDGCEGSLAVGGYVRGKMVTSERNPGLFGGNRFKLGDLWRKLFGWIIALEGTLARPLGRQCDGGEAGR